MKRILSLFAALLFGALLLPAAAATRGAAAPNWQHPVVKDYGGALALPQAELQPDKNATYKVAFNLTKSSGGDVNAGLNHVARAVNVFALAGVPRDHLKFIVVIHGPATELVMNDKAYRAHFHRANPNDKIIDELTAAGVRLVVCGQALAEAGIAHDELNPKIHLSLSALSDLIVLQHDGYALYPL
ncbi:MAG TPA: DsrE family protein [Gammaproteobacteria bacterium]|jgi:intracellular sulfur oxidation DsrE/DsrF family protein|nr:DsrE family protein [Gammaproteobacteria bacterium]